MSIAVVIFRKYTHILQEYYKTENISAAEEQNTRAYSHIFHFIDSLKFGSNVYFYDFTCIEMSEKVCCEL